MIGEARIDETNCHAARAAPHPMKMELAEIILGGVRPWV
jgi:hypothetical protein